MAHSAEDLRRPAGGGGGQSELVRSCREELLHYEDPSLLLKLQLQLAVAEERFEDATK